MNQLVQGQYVREEKKVGLIDLSFRITTSTMKEGSTKRSPFVAFLFLLQIIEALNVHRINNVVSTSDTALKLSTPLSRLTPLTTVIPSTQRNLPNLNELEKEIVALGRRGSTDDALRLYESIEAPNIRILNSVIDACARARPTRLESAFELLDQGIQQKGLVPNVFTFGAIMSACNRARRADRAVQLLRTMQVHILVVKSESLRVVGNSPFSIFRH